MGRVVPWVSWEEWRQVSAWLWSASPRDVSRGTERVSAWRARGRVPVGADITATLVEVSQQDALWSSGDSRGAQNEQSIRLAYSMALVRLVNGVVDSGQKGQSASSVAHLATTFGLPRLLVDIRHEATHNSLPSLAVLRLASRSALSWLHDHYWGGQQQYLSDNQNRIQTTLSNFLEIYRQSWLRSRSGDDGSQAEAEPSTATVRQQRRAVLSALKDSVPTAATHLLADPLLQVLLGHLQTEQATPESAGRKRSRESSCSGWDWDEALSALSEEWPLLPGVTLSRAIEQGCQALKTASHATAHSYAALTSRLLEALPLATRPGTTKSRKRGSLSGQASAQEDKTGRLGQQLLTLVRQIMLEANQVWAVWQSSARDDSQEQTLRAWLGAALEVAAALPVGRQQERALFLVKQMLSVVDLECQMPANLWQEAPLPSCVSAPGQEAAAVGRGGKAVGSQTKTAAWSLAAKWEPCAIGCLPSGSNPNGSLPRLSEVLGQSVQSELSGLSSTGTAAPRASQADAAGPLHVMPGITQQEGEWEPLPVDDAAQDALQPLPEFGTCKSLLAWQLSQGSPREPLLVRLM